MELTLGTLVIIDDPSENIKGLVGVVLSHDVGSNKVMYRIVTNDYVGKATFKTNRWNCTVIGRYEGNLNY
jgi:hypothetical protein